MSEKWKERLLTAWIIVFSAAVIYALYDTQKLIEENRQRIRDNRAGQVRSCHLTYQALTQTLNTLAPLYSSPYNSTNERAERLKFLYAAFAPENCTDVYERSVQP